MALPVVKSGPPVYTREQAASGLYDPGMSNVPQPPPGYTTSTGQVLGPVQPTQTQQPSQPQPLTQEQLWDKQWYASGNTGQRPVGYHGYSGSDISYQDFQQQQAQDQARQKAELDAQINEVYNPTMGYLNQAEQTVRSQYPSVQEAAQKAYESSMADLTGARTKNEATIGENTIQATQRKEDALAAARRLYDELRRGYRQRFGGSTSAGMAASELSSVEQQRQQGGIQRDYGTTIRQIENQKLSLDQDYQTGSAKIKASLTQALQQAQNDFQNKLLEIAGMRASTESQKAQAKLGALQTLQQQAYAEQQAAKQNQWNLDNFYKQQQADLQNYAAKLAMAGQGATSVVNQYLPQATSNLTASATNQQTSTPLAGSISTTGKKWWEV